MTVHELSQRELDELKVAYFYSEDVDDEILGEITSWDEIPNDVIFNHYEGIWFVKDDFFCNIEERRDAI